MLKYHTGWSVGGLVGFETRSRVAQAGLGLLILLSLPPKCGNHRPIPSCLGFHLPMNIIVLPGGRQGEARDTERAESSSQPVLFVPKTQTQNRQKMPLV